jgi:hypothetical protein
MGKSKKAPDLRAVAVGGSARLCLCSVPFTLLVLNAFCAYHVSNRERAKGLPCTYLLFCRRVCICFVVKGQHLRLLLRQRSPLFKPGFACLFVHLAASRLLQLSGGSEWKEKEECFSNHGHGKDDYKSEENTNTEGVSGEERRVCGLFF